MSFVRSTPARALRQLHSLRVARQSSNVQQFQRVGRRGYASATESVKKGADAAKHAVSSDMPWLITSILVTVPGTYLILNSGPAPHEGGHDDHGKHEEHEEEEEASAEEEEKTEAEEEKTEDAEEKPEEKSGDRIESAKDGKNQHLAEVPDDNSLSKKTASGESASNDEEVELENENSDSKKIHKPDAKGGAKRRIESANAEKLGENDNTEGDSAAASKEPVPGQTSSKQAGLSNTDTKHSTKIDEDPEKSKKPEGGPDTAKAQGTVDPSRPAS